MRIAQHFSAGIKSRFTNESVKRTTEIERFSADSDSAFSRNRNRKSVFSRQLRGLIRSPDRTPAINRWATFTSSAPRTTSMATFLGKAPLD
jgi:hypothetical protein